VRTSLRLITVVMLNELRREGTKHLVGSDFFIAKEDRYPSEVSYVYGTSLIEQPLH